MDGTARKVVVHNVLKFLRPNEAKQLVASWLEGKEHLGIVIEKFKKPPMDNWIRVVLEKESMVEPFLNVINTGGPPDEDGGEGAMVNRKGKRLHATKENNNKHDNRDGGGGRKRKGRDGDDRDGPSKKRGDGGNKFTAETVMTDDEVRDKITPMWKMSYEDQLQTKHKEMVKKSAMKICMQMKKKVW